MYERTYHAKVLTQNASPEKKRRRRFPVRRFVWSLLLVVLAAGVVVLIRLPGLQVKTIEVEGASVADPEEVTLLIRSQMEGNYFYFFPRTSMLLVPTSTIAHRLQRQFPRFASVDIRRKGLNGLAVTIVEHTGTALWCDRGEIEEQCFFMTDTGLVFAEAPFFSGDAYERMYGGTLAGLPFSPLTTEQLATIHTLRDRLPSLSIAPVEYHVVSERELDIVFVHHGARARLMIDLANDVEKTLEDLATGLATEPLSGQFKDSKKILEYLDARFSNKVVYKFK